MTILSVIQTVCKELSLTAPSAVVGSTDLTVIQLLAFAEREGKETRNKWRWPQLNREFTWTLAASQANYAFNTDYDYQVFCTHWDRSQYWQLVGPVSEQEWQALKSGVVTTTPRREFRIKGAADRQIYIHPTPTSSDNGLTMVFEYQSKNWIRPKTWAASTTFAAGAYCFYNGNYYSTTLGGVTGSTAPTHTSSSASDGVVTWAYYSGLYDTFLADTDVSLLDEDILALGTKWRFRKDKGLEFESFKRDAEESWKRSSHAQKGNKVLSLNSIIRSPLLSELNIPETGWGEEA